MILRECVMNLATRASRCSGRSADGPRPQRKKYFKLAHQDERCRMSPAPPRSRTERAPAPAVTNIFGMHRLATADAARGAACSPLRFFERIWLARPVQLFWAAILFLGAVRTLQAQVNSEIDIFATGTGEDFPYHDASTGSATSPSQLTLTGPFTSKLPVVHAPGRKGGLLQWISAPAGEWRLVLASPGWSRIDATSCQSLEFLVNAPESIKATQLPKIHLQSNLNFDSAATKWGKFFPEGVDADSNTWQVVRIPLTAFQPMGQFALDQFKAIIFSQNLPDAQARSLWFDQLRFVSTNAPANTNAPVAPRKLVVRSGDQSVALHWENAAEKNLRGFQVYRAPSREGPFVKVSKKPVSIRSFADVDVANGQSYFYRVSAVNRFGESGFSDAAQAAPKPFANNGEFLDLVQRTAFDYFWYEANPENGLVRDRSQPYSTASVAATGFGLTAIGIGVDRGWITRAQGRERVLTTLKTYWRQPQGTASSGVIGYKGWFYHFLEMDTATRAGTCELSSIDTALFFAGAIYAKEYFDQRHSDEVEIRALATELFDRIDWNWMANGEDSLSHGWRPEAGFIQHRWIGYNEGMILYLLGMGAAKNPLPAMHWQRWTDGYKWETHCGYEFLNFPPLFGHQYSHCWIDFRGITDDYLRKKGLTYFENSRRATLAQRAYGIANPGKGYGSNLWGWTASDGPGTLEKRAYAARGTPPPLNEDGTIAPTAAGGSLAFTPEYSLAALRNFYDQFRVKIWTGYGFRDAFNLEIDWWGSDVLGIDQGPILLMAENYRSENVWRIFMKNPEIQRGLQRAGFREYDSDK